MQYIFDAVIIALIVLIGIDGFRRGLLVSATSMGAKLVALIAAVFLHVPFTKLLDSVFNLHDKISSKVSVLVNSAVDQKASEFSSDSLAQFGSSMKEMLAYQLTNSISSYVLKIISFLLMLFLIYLVFSILIRVFIRPITRLKPVSILDKSAGLLVSCICAVFFISLFCGLTESFWQVVPWFDSAAKSTFTYPLFMWAYEPFMNGINAFFGSIFINPLDSLPTLNSMQI